MQSESQQACLCIKAHNHQFFAQRLAEAAATDVNKGVATFDAFWEFVLDNMKRRKRINGKQRIVMLRYLLATAGAISLLHPEDPCCVPLAARAAAPADKAFLEKWHTFALASTGSNRRSLRALLQSFISMLMVHDRDFAGTVLAERFHSVAASPSTADEMPIESSVSLAMVQPQMGSPQSSVGALSVASHASGPGGAHCPPTSPAQSAATPAAPQLIPLVRRLLTSTTSASNETFLAMLRQYGGQCPGQLALLLGKYMKAKRTRYAALGTLFRLFTGRPVGLELVSTVGAAVLPHLVETLQVALVACTAAAARAPWDQAAAREDDFGSPLRQSSADSMLSVDSHASGGSLAPHVRTRGRQASAPPRPSPSAVGAGRLFAAVSPSSRKKQAQAQLGTGVDDVSGGVLAMLRQTPACLEVCQYDLSCAGLAVWALAIVAPACLPSLAGVATPFAASLALAAQVTAVLLAHTNRSSTQSRNTTSSAAPKSTKHSPAKAGSSSSPGQAAPLDNLAGDYAPPDERHRDLTHLRQSLEVLGMHDALVVLLATAFTAFPHSTLPVLQGAVHRLRTAETGTEKPPPTPVARMSAPTAASSEAMGGTSAASVFVHWCAQGLAPVASSALASLLDTDAFHECSTQRWAMVDTGKWYLDLLAELGLSSFHAERSTAGDVQAVTGVRSPPPDDMPGPDDLVGNAEACTPVLGAPGVVLVQGGAAAPPKQAEEEDTFAPDDDVASRGGNDAESIVQSVSAASSGESNPLQAQWTAFLMQSHVSVRQLVSAALNKYLKDQVPGGLGSQVSPKAATPSTDEQEGSSMGTLESVFFPSGIPKGSTPLMMHELAFERHMRQLEVRRSRRLQAEVNELASSQQAVAALRHRVEQLARESVMLRQHAQTQTQAARKTLEGAGAQAQALQHDLDVSRSEVQRLTAELQALQSAQGTAAAPADASSSGPATPTRSTRRSFAELTTPPPSSSSSAAVLSQVGVASPAFASSVGPVAPPPPGGAAHVSKAQVGALQIELRATKEALGSARADLLRWQEYEQQLLGPLVAYAQAQGMPVPSMPGNARGSEGARTASPVWNTSGQETPELLRPGSARSDLAGRRSSDTLLSLTGGAAGVDAPRGRRRSGPGISPVHLAGESTPVSGRMMKHLGKIGFIQ